MRSTEYDFTHPPSPRSAIGTMCAVVLLGFILNGCEQTAKTEPAREAGKPADTSSKPAAIPPDHVAAVVNGKTIAKSALTAQQRAPTPPGMQEKMLDELIVRELVRQDFEKQQLQKDPEIAEKLDNMLRVSYSQLAAEHFTKSLQISDEEIRKAYEEKYPPNQPGEYKARHILVDAEEQARDVIAQLKKGAKFEELAKKLSKDPGSKDKGGDLGWFEPGRMDPAFSAGVASLANGAFSETPVHSKFGWHVILREDAREKKAPDFEGEREKIRNALRMQKFQQHIEDLKKSAQIERKPLPAPPAAQARPGMPPLMNPSQPVASPSTKAAPVAPHAEPKR